MLGTTNLLKRSVSSFVTLIIGILVFVSIPGQIALYESEGLSSVNARTVPYLITSLIVIISLSMIISDAIAIRQEATDAAVEKPEKDTSYGRVFLAFVAIALWIVILPYLGFTLSTILLVASVMIIIGNCRWWQIVLLSLILSVPINYLLAAVLRVYLPSGSFFG
ncbi:MAG: tripartite tricarboxylate transporter TctB family protein [Paracoccaceae bacterium]